MTDQFPIVHLAGKPVCSLRDEMHQHLKMVEIVERGDEMVQGEWLFIIKDLEKKEKLTFPISLK